jgi:2OG-Fe(II) oxygenase superfamily
MKNFISEYKNALNKKTCNEIISWMDSCNYSKGYSGDGDVNLNKKNSLDLNLSFDIPYPINDVVFSTLNNCLIKYKKEHPELDIIRKWKINSSYNAQKYFPGMGYYATHCEQELVDTLDGSAVNRIISWMIYLNTIHFDGGTNFPVLKKKIKAESGKCVIWPAGWTHMHHGIVAKKHTKYILTGWYSFY